MQACQRQNKEILIGEAIEEPHPLVALSGATIDGVVTFKLLEEQLPVLVDVLHRISTGRVTPVLSEAA